MLNIVKKSILSGVVILALSACGSSSSSDDKNSDDRNSTSSNSFDTSDINNSFNSSDTNNSFDTSDVNNSFNSSDTNNSFDTSDTDSRVNNIRKGFYIDSAIKGVDYRCGDENGTTDSNGTFRFEEGKECIFTLGNIILREFNTTELEDNVVIIEKDIDNARLLQTLDNDGNPDNGIEITRNVLDAIKDSGNLVPVGDDELSGIFRNAQTAEGYDGAMVTIEEAKSHITDTLTGLGLDNYLDSLDDASGLLDSLDSDDENSTFNIFN